MPVKISKIARECNVGVNTAAEFLRKHGVEVDGNPNARIDDSAVELLYKEYKVDKDAKAQSDLMTSSNPKKVARQKNTEIRTEVKPKGPKVLGKIDLETVGKAKVEVKSASDDTARTEEVKKEIPTPAAESAKDTKVENPASSAPQKPAEEAEKRVQEEKPVKAVSEESDTTAEKRDVAEKKGNDKVQPERVSKPAEKGKSSPVEDGSAAGESPIRKESQGAARSAAPEDVKSKATSDSAVSGAPEQNKVVSGKVELKESNEDTDNMGTNEDNKPFRLHPNVEGPKLKVLGTIDLSTLDSSSKGRKRGDKKGQKGNKSSQGGASSADKNAQGGARNKRKRISQAKVDIDKAGQQAAQNGKGRDQGGNGRGNDNNRQRNGGNANQRGGANQRGNQRRGARPEVNSEDVQKQVKETLARLTNKQTKKSVKWRKEKREEIHNRERKNAEREAAESKVLKITEFVTANDLAQMMDIPINNVIATCMSLGVMVSINQRLDAETINIVAEEFGFTTEYVSAEVSEAITTEEDSEEDLLPRPPIVTVMGHVDHGKTSLLDYIRKANVIAGEAGGITQHIGAYNVELGDGRHITFLDTPGHEAFTAMRARGAKVTDLAIIIVAADDDVMPQTREAINHASAAGVPIVFAINKIDKPTSNPDKIKEELASMNYLVEEWGGKYQSQDISAKKGIGVEELMEKVLLEAELLDLKANPNRAAIGSVIESSLDKGRGYVATVLVQNGTLRVGDVVLAGTHYGKIKAMFNERNQRVKEAGPATPVLVLGLNGAPTAGDTFNVMPTEQEAREIAGKREQLQRELGLRTKKRLGLEELGRRRALNDFHELNLVVKGDVDGSVEALSDSLIKLSTPEVQVNVLHKGVGAISESDVTLAAASDAIIIGFQVRPSGAARKEADKEGVEIRLYSVIYKAIEEVKDAMEGMLAPEIKEEITGTAEVLQTYHISKVGTIAGAIVREGKIKRTSKVRLIRDGIVTYTGELGSLKRFKDDVKEVIGGYDCGLSIQGYNDVREGDLIEAYEEVEVKKTLS